MTKYRIYFYTQESDWIDVEAEDLDDAIVMAEKAMGSEWEYEDYEELPD